MNWKMKDFDMERMRRLVDDGIPELEATIIANRDNGIYDKKSAIEYIKQGEESIEAPENITNMSLAADIVTRVGGKACIFGDYDVDGVTSTFMARRMLKDLGYSTVKSFIPRREEDGYGLNEKSIENFLEATRGISFNLFMILDCGSSSDTQIRQIKRQWPDAKIVVIDHHLIEDESFSSMADAVVNPRIGNCHPYCTGGLMMQLARMILPKEKLNRYYPYGAMATIADVCSLQGSNRGIVIKGLEEIKKTKDVGLRKMFEVSNKDIQKCTAEDIGFGIAPMINAAGRISDANIALMAMEENDEERALEIAQELYTLNSTRKDIQSEIFAMVTKELSSGDKKRTSILVHGDWNPGVVGIVAGQLAEKYSCPAICFGKSNDGRIHGSARSRSGINIKEVMDLCSHIFLRYGGHEQAAGATLDPKYREEAWDIFDHAVKTYMKKNGIKSIPVLYDAEMSSRQLASINDKVCDRINAMEPFGNSNERPIIRANGLKCNAVYEWSSGKGGFVKVEGVKMDMYAMTENLKEKMEGNIVDILFTIERSFMDESKWAIRIQKANLSEIN